MLDIWCSGAVFFLESGLGFGRWEDLGAFGDGVAVGFEDECTVVVVLAALFAWSGLVASSKGTLKTGGAAGTALDVYTVCDWILVNFNLNRGLGEAFGVRGFFQRSCTAGFRVGSACFAYVDTVAAVFAVGAGVSFAFAGFAGLLELWWNDEFAFHVCIIACCAWVVVGIFNESAVIIAQLETGFATSSLRVAFCQSIQCQAILPF